MKRIYKICLFILLYLLSIPEGKTQSDTLYEKYIRAYPKTENFKVLSIDEVKKSDILKCYGVYKGRKKVRTAYLIKLESEDSSLFMVVSLKKRNIYSKKIKIGDSYLMTIIPYWKENRVPNHALNLGVVIDGVHICVPMQGWIGNVYTTMNLKGLYYIPSGNVSN